VGRRCLRLTNGTVVAVMEPVSLLAASDVIHDGFE